MIVAVDSFDTPNRQTLYPKKYVSRVTRPRHANRGPVYPTHVDRRVSGTQTVYSRYDHATPQNVHLLLLSAIDVSTIIPEPDRQAVVDARHARCATIQVIRTFAYSADRLGDTPAAELEGTVSNRRYDPKDCYESVCGRHIGSKRYIWLWGSDQTVVQSDDGTASLRAIGCTCSDMQFRGRGMAQTGCKHVLAFNQCAERDNVQWP